MLVPGPLFSALGLLDPFGPKTRQSVVVDRDGIQEAEDRDGQILSQRQSPVPTSSSQPLSPLSHELIIELIRR